MVERAADPAGVERDAAELVYLLSLPRSGSTALQRLLAAHPQISSSQETWLPVAVLGGLDAMASHSVYGTAHAEWAADEFFGQAGATRRRLYEVCRDALLSRRTSGASVFLEKSPRNALIAPQIGDLDDGARFVVLVRDPWAVLRSMARTWTWSGPLPVDQFWADLELAPVRLADLVATHGDRCLVVRYDRLRRDPDGLVDEVVRWLGLPAAAAPRPAPEDDAALVGEFGDPDQRGGEWTGGGRSTDHALPVVATVWWRGYRRRVAGAYETLGLELPEEPGGRLDWSVRANLLAVRSIARAAVVVRVWRRRQRRAAAVATRRRSRAGVTD